MTKSHSYLAATVIGGAALATAAWGQGTRGELPALAQAAPSPPAFAQCRACHTVTKSGAAGVGPNLFGTLGAAAGTRPGFAYSPAMTASKIRWNRAKLDAFLTDPKALVPGTKMMFAGVKDPVKRKAIVDYLETLK